MRLAARLGWLALAAVPVAFLAVFFAWPVLGMLGRGLAPGGVLDLGAVPEVLGRRRTQRVLGLTLWLSCAATALTLALGLPVAFVTARLALLPGRAGAVLAEVLRAWAVVPFVLPTIVVGVMFRALLSRGGPLGGLGLDRHWSGILAALVFFNVSVVVRTVGGAWAGLDQRPAQAAAALGASPGQVLRTVTLPALAPAVASAASVVLLFCTTAFGVVLTLGGLRYATLETEVYLLTTQMLDLRAAAVLSLLQLATVPLVLLATSRARAVQTGGTQRARAAQRPGQGRRPPTARDIPAIVVTALTLAGIALPVATLLVRSLTTPHGPGLDHYRALLHVTGTNALQAPVTTALATSLRTAVDATWLSLALGVAVALLTTRRARSRAGALATRGLDALFMLPLGVSAVTVGFGFLITLDRPPLDLRSSPVLVPIAQALVALPLVVRTLAPVIEGIDPRQREAAATLGAGPLRQWLTSDAPVLARPVLAAAGLAFAVSLGEFGATSFLARPERPTLPVTIYQLIGRPGAENQGMALAAAVVLAAATTLVMAAVERLGVRSAGAV